MPRRQAVYGKRRVDTELVAECFGVSDSPIQPIQPQCDSNTTQLSHRLRPTDRDFQDANDRDASMDGIASALEALGISVPEDDVSYQGTKAASISHSGIKKERQTPVLADIDANARRRLSADFQNPKATSCGKSNANISKTKQSTLQRSLIERSSALKKARSPSERPSPDPRGGSPRSEAKFDHTDSVFQTTPTRVRRSSRTRTDAAASPCSIIDFVEPLRKLSNDPTCGFGSFEFRAWGDSIASFFDVVKIAEASYGEVYRLSLNEPHAKFTPGTESVLKFIALKPPLSSSSSSQQARTKAQQKRIEGMSAVSNVASEVRLLRHMSSVPGFANFRDVKVMQGQLPKQFVSAWRDFNKNVKKSGFPDPGRKTSYEEGQLWAIVEMQDAGSDLETVKMETIWECWDVFWGVAMSLAKGEEYATFEHRDLHLGNICVKHACKLKVEDIDITRNVGFTTLETMLIDYTLSRAEIGEEESHSPRKKSPSAVRSAVILPTADEGTETVFFDLALEPSVFCGDAEEDYQYEIYRYMRSAVLHGDACHDTIPPRAKAITQIPASQTSRWRQHQPLTNLLWLHYILHKLSEQMQWPSSCTDPKRLSTKERRVRETALQLESRLQTIIDLLDPSKLRIDDGVLQSARDLVVMAVERDWLSEGDVTGARGQATVELDISRLRIGCDQDVGDQISKG
ncbi:MAG: hypothetical protein M1828_000326 [Chrysothrix sp. TS-e1954]|nr:MAG: hypothetical protein M1828_000326 [Chrysothrix sp. TS-e1954]